eukprot:gene528-739_t
MAKGTARLSREDRAALRPRLCDDRVAGTQQAGKSSPEIGVAIGLLQHGPIAEARLKA